MSYGNSTLGIYLLRADTTILLFVFLKYIHYKYICVALHL